METQKYSNRANANSQQIIRNTSDKVCLATKKLTLSNTAQALNFSGIQIGDVGSVIIKVKKAGSPTDSTHLVRYTMVDTDAPTTTHGMWYGDGDVFEVSNNKNVIGLKLIAAELGIFSILSIEYYGM